MRYVDPDIVCEQNAVGEAAASMRSMTVLGDDVIVPLEGEPVGEQKLAWYARTR